MSIWCDDICSFEAILKFLNVDDIVALTEVNKSFKYSVRKSCLHVNSLSLIRSQDIDLVLRESLFPNLQSVTQMHIDSKMYLADAQKIMNRWENWSSCTLSTERHTRRAFCHVMRRIRNIQKLTIHIGYTNIFERFQICNHIHILMRKNPSLSQLHLCGTHVNIDMVRALKNSRLKKIQISMNVQHDIPSIFTWLPPTVECLKIMNTVPHVRSTIPPYYLTWLHELHNLNDLALIDCLHTCVDSRCITWDILKRFCRTTKLEKIEISELNVECVNALAQSGVAHLQTLVIDCPQHSRIHWLKSLPQNYNINFYDIPYFS